MKVHQMVFILFLLSGLSQAASATDYVTTVCKLQSHNDKHIASLAPCETWTSKNSCSKGGWILWDINEFQGKAMYSTALTSLAAGLKIQVRLDGSTCETGSGTATYDVTSMIRILR